MYFQYSAGVYKRAGRIDDQRPLGLVTLDKLADPFQEHGIGVILVAIEVLVLAELRAGAFCPRADVVDEDAVRPQFHDLLHPSHHRVLVCRDVGARGVHVLRVLRFPEAGSLEVPLRVDLDEFRMILEVHLLITFRGISLIKRHVRETADPQGVAAGEEVAIDRAMRDELHLRLRQCLPITPVAGESIGFGVPQPLRRRLAEVDLSAVCATKGRQSSSMATASTLSTPAVLVRNVTRLKEHMARLFLGWAQDGGKTRNTSIMGFAATQCKRGSALFIGSCVAEK